MSSRLSRHLPGLLHHLHSRAHKNAYLWTQKYFVMSANGDATHSKVAEQIAVDLSTFIKDDVSCIFTPQRAVIGLMMAMLRITREA